MERTLGSLLPQAQHTQQHMLALKGDGVRSEGQGPKSRSARPLSVQGEDMAWAWQHAM